MKEITSPSPRERENMNLNQLGKSTVNEVLQLVINELYKIYPEEMLKRIPQLPKELEGLINKSIAMVVLGASGTGKTTFVKLLALNNNFNKVVVCSWTRQFKDLQLIHNREVTYVEAKDLMEYIASDIELDYILGKNVLIVIEDFNRTVEVAKHKMGMSMRRIIEYFNTAITNIRKYGAKLVIIAHDIKELKPILDHMGASANLDTWIIFRLAVTPQRARSIAKRLGFEGLYKALTEANRLSIGEFNVVSRYSSTVISGKVDMLPSHDAVEKCRLWLLAEADIKTKKDLIVFLKKRYPKLSYRDIARLTGFSEKYVAKVLSIARAKGLLERPKKSRR